jgi:hypothetical protein
VTVDVRTEAEIVGAVLVALARIVAADDALLTVRCYDARRRSLTLALADLPGGDRVGGGPDVTMVREFVVEALRHHGIRLDELRIDDGSNPAASARNARSR